MLVLRGYQANPTSWSLILEDVKSNIDQLSPGGSSSLHFRYKQTIEGQNISKVWTAFATRHQNKGHRTKVKL